MNIRYRAESSKSIVKGRLLVSGKIMLSVDVFECSKAELHGFCCHLQGDRSG